MSVLDIITPLDWYSYSKRSVVERLMIREQENNDEIAVLLHGTGVSMLRNLEAATDAFKPADVLSKLVDSSSARVRGGALAG
ncbi:Fumarate hydratase 1, mitochondrial [Musa troglodytarum]|uniref:Fumarate hydratase 1, mitochondrial n=1 Tax=Musa troglodytarum TaxID=320322 RepID=A0A9E7HJD8_9LILI|nr:Fumarate hydratase 1, mitochondrial [Musa troglodytarum]